MASGGGGGRIAAVVFVLVPALFLAMFLGVALMWDTVSLASCTPTGAASPADPGNVPEGPVAGYDHEQLVNAAHVMLAAQQLGLTARDQQIGVMTAMGESGLRVLDHGDNVGPDSRGLFQQRDNGAWGSYVDRMDPQISSTNFFKAEMAIDGRESMPPTLVAHAVQGNADPYYYEPFWEPAGAVVHALAGVTQPGAASPSSSEQPGQSPYQLGAVQPHTATVANSVGPMFGIKTVGGYRPPSAGQRDPNGHPAGLALDFMINDIPDGVATGERLAHYLQVHAADLGVRYVIWQQHIWSVERTDEGWRAMEDRGSPTENHMDHVHLSLTGAGGTGDGSAAGGPGCPALAAATGASFRAATFNALGDSHTDAGGDRAGWASGEERMRAFGTFLMRQNVDVLALQEFQPEQQSVFEELTGEAWTVHAIRDNAVAWRSSRFTLVDQDSITIPYFHGEKRQMPVVTLRSTDTGAQIVVISVHNPADVRGPARKWRDQAVAIERAYVRDQGSTPTLLMGDFNDKDRAFCAVTDDQLMTSPAGGKHTGGSCTPPEDTAIDWIFGSPSVQWSDFVLDRSTRESRVSDHVFVAGTATVLGSWQQPAAGAITDTFGPRKRGFHTGLDIGAACGNPILAANDGQVVRADSAPGTGYGNLVEVDHGGGVHTRYAHMYNDGVLVRVGDRVAAGQQIATIGSLGNSTGCHLHFEVLLDGHQVDPQPFLASVGVTIHQ